MGNNWQEVCRTDAILYCEKSGFKCSEIDPFAMEEQKFILKENDRVRFKFKMVMSDPVKYYIYPIVNGNGVTVKELKEAAGIAESECK